MVAAWSMFTPSTEMREESAFRITKQRVYILASSTTTGTKRRSSIMGKSVGEEHR
jgi:hypothetical protein